MKGMLIRNGYYVLAQQLRGEIIRAPNTRKKFNELLFVFFIDASKNIDLGVLPPCRNCLSEHLKRFNYHAGIWKRAYIAKPVYTEPTHNNSWQCVDGMIEPKWMSGDFIPQQLADVLIQENIAVESDESDDEFDDVLYSLIDGEEEN